MARPSIFEFAGGEPAFLAAVRDVLSYSPPGSRVAAELPVPRWSWEGLIPSNS